MPDQRNRATSAFSSVVEYEDLVEALRDGPRRKQTLVDRLGVSPETIYRRTRDFRDHGLLERTPSGYALTNLGHLYARQYEFARTITQELYDIRDLLEHFEVGDLPPWDLFRNAEVVTVEQRAPDRPARRLETTIRRAERLHGLFPVLSHRIAATLGDVAGTVESLDLTLDAAILGHYADDPAFTDAFDADCATVRRTDDTAPYGVLLVEDGESTSAAMTVYDDRGTLRGVVVNDSPAAVAWGEEVYDRYRTESARVSP